MKTQYKLGMFTAYIGFAISTLAGFILPPLIIGHLGSELNGLYNALTSFSVYFGMMDLGLGTAIIRFVAKYRAEGEIDRIPKYLYVMRYIYTLICVFTMFIGFGIMLFVPNIFKSSIPAGYERQAQFVFLFSLLSIVVTIFDNLYYSTIKAYELFFTSRSSEIVRVILRVILIISLLNLGYSVVSISFADFLTTFIIMLYRMLYVKTNLAIQFQKPKANEISIKEVFAFSAYIVIYSLSEKIFWQLDKVLLGIMSGGISVTIYTIGSQISSSISSVSSTVSSMYLPHAVRTSKKEDNYTEIMAQMARYQLFVIIPVFLGFILFGRAFIHLWVGNGYDESFNIAVVLIATLIPVLLQSYGESLLKALNIQKVYATSMIVSVIVNILLTITLIPRIGAFGAALASAVVNVLRCIFMAFYYQRTLDIGIISFIKFTTKNMFMSILLSLFAGYCLIHIFSTPGWPGLILEIVVFTCVYVISVYFTALNDRELIIVHGIIGKIRKRD